MVFGSIKNHNQIRSGFILCKNPINALYMLTPLYSHCYTAACFSPQWAILREYWYF
jgi:hypothetical protein